MYKFSLFASALLCGGILFAGCSGSGSSKSADSTLSKPTFDTTAAKKEINAVNETFMQSLAKGDSVAVAGCYATDAKLMVANMPAIAGRKNIQSVFAGLIKAGAAKMELNTLNIWGNADLIAEEGTFVLSTKNGHQMDKGKYIVLWKKEDGKWKISRDCSNSDLPVTK
jgi:uncharacterized protein (TIGR02246 family)